MKCAYGVENVFECARSGKVKTAIVMESRSDLMGEILPLSKSTNFDIETISENSSPGGILDKAFGGIVAILRY